MPSLLTCPSCGRKLRVPPDLMGRRVKCPSCGSTFEGTEEEPSPAPEPAASPNLATDEEGAAAPPAGPAAIRPGPTSERDGPGQELDQEPREDEDDEEDERPWERRRRVRRDAEPHRGTLILVLGIVSVSLSPLAFCCGLFGILFSLTGLSLGIPTWVMGRGDLRKMDQGVMDPDGRGSTQGGMICGIIGTILGGLGLLLFGVLVAFYAALMTWGLKNAGPPPPVPPSTFPAPPPPVRPVPPPRAPRKLGGDAAPLRLQDYLPAAAP